MIRKAILFHGVFKVVFEKDLSTHYQERGRSVMATGIDLVTMATPF